MHLRYIERAYRAAHPSLPVSARWPLVGWLRFLTAMTSERAATVGRSSPLRISRKRMSARMLMSRNLHGLGLSVRIQDVG